MQSRARDSQTHLTWPDTRCLRCLKAWQSSRSCELCLPDWGWGCTAVRPASDCRQDRHQHWDRTGTTSCLHPANNLQSCKLPAVLLSIRVTLEEGCHCPATVLPLSCHCPATLQTSSWPWGSYQFLPTALVTPTATCHHPDGNILWKL